MRHYLSIIAGLLLLAVQPASTVLAADEEAAVTEAMHELFPDMEITRVRESAIEGLYEVMAGPDIYYVSGDGQFLLRGDMYDLNQRRNITEARRESVRTEILAGIPASEYIEFAPENPQHVIYVFTDVTCGYCRKLHQDVPVLNQHGMAVRYLAFPRQGPGSSAYGQMVSVWCADDRNAALTAAKQGQRIESATCPNPVRQQFRLGRRIGIRGTPAIFLEDGREIPGYKPPEELISLVNGKQ